MVVGCYWWESGCSAPMVFICVRLHCHTNVDVIDFQYHIIWLCGYILCENEGKKRGAFCPLSGHKKVIIWANFVLILEGRNDGWTACDSFWPAISLFFLSLSVKCEPRTPRSVQRRTPSDPAAQCTCTVPASHFFLLSAYIHPTI